MLLPAKETLNSEKDRLLLTGQKYCPLSQEAPITEIIPETGDFLRYRERAFCRYGLCVSAVIKTLPRYRILRRKRVLTF